MTLNGNAVSPLYAQLMEDLEAKICDGTFAPGERLLSENEMAKRYGVSIITVRKAALALEEKGLVEKRQGKGTFVARRKYTRDMKNLQSFTELCARYGVKAGGKMLENRIVTPDDKTARLLGIDKGGQAVFISRLRFADEEPVVIENNYFPLSYSFLLEQQFDDSSLFDYLKKQKNITVDGSEKWFEICRARPEEAELLHVKRRDPLLRIRSVTYSAGGSPLYVGTQLANGECFSFYVYESGRG